MRKIINQVYASGLSKLSIRSIIALLFVFGALVIAYIDPSFRDNYARLADVALGGYLGQLVPRSKD